MKKEIEEAVISIEEARLKGVDMLNGLYTMANEVDYAGRARFNVTGR